MGSKGGFETVCFERVTAYDLEVEGATVEFPLNIDYRQQDHFWNYGARSNYITSLEEHLFVRSGPIRDVCGARCFWENFLASPIHYIRTVDGDGKQVMRRVVVDMETSRLYEFGKITRLVVGFRFTSKLNHH